MGFENERPPKSKIAVAAEIALVTLMAIVCMYVACMSVHASTVSDNDFASVFSTSKFEEKEGYFIVEISDTECAYVPEGYPYWIVSDQYVVVGNNPIVLHTLSDGRYQIVGSDTSGYFSLHRSGELRSRYIYFKGADCGHGWQCESNWQLNAAIKIVYDGNYLLCEEGEQTATPEPENTATPDPDSTATPVPSESPEPTLTPYPVVTYEPLPTEVPFFEATPEDLSVTNILLLLIFCLELADFILKRIGGIFRVRSGK